MLCSFHTSDGIQKDQIYRQQEQLNEVNRDL